MEILIKDFDENLAQHIEVLVHLQLGKYIQTCRKAASLVAMESQDRHADRQADRQIQPRALARKEKYPAFCMNWEIKQLRSLGALWAPK